MPVGPAPFLYRSQRARKAALGRLLSHDVLALPRLPRIPDDEDFGENNFGANPKLQHLLPYASRVALPHTCKACFRLAGCAFAGRESNPLDRYERFQLV
jgi:hypothetical protein